MDPSGNGYISDYDYGEYCDNCLFTYKEKYPDYKFFKIENPI